MNGDIQHNQLAIVGVEGMKESTTDRAIYREGMQRGRQEGHLRPLQEKFLRVLRKRFTTIPNGLDSCIGTTVEVALRHPVSIDKLEDIVL